MRVFKDMNRCNGDKCPICKTDKEGEVVLIGIQGTEEGNIMEAKQFHLECLELLYNTEVGVIYQKIGE